MVRMFIVVGVLRQARDYVMMYLDDDDDEKSIVIRQ